MDQVEIDGREVYSTYNDGTPLVIPIGVYFPLPNAGSGTRIQRSADPVGAGSTGRAVPRLTMDYSWKAPVTCPGLPRN